METFAVTLGLDPDALGIYATAAVLSSPRLLAFTLVLPLLTRFQLTGIISFGVVAALSLVVIPAVIPAVARAENLDPLLLAALIGKEAFLGLILGLMFGLPFWAAETAGNAMDLQRGSAVAIGAEPTGASEASPLGVFFLLLFTAVVLSNGGFITILDGFYRSFTVWPPTELSPALPVEAAPFFLGILDDILRIGLIYASPFFISMFLVEVTLALLTRFAPQLNVFILALPIKCGIIFGIFPLYFGYLITYFQDDARAWTQVIDQLEVLLP